MKIKTVHPLLWIAEPLESEPTFLLKKMFGCEALCLHGKQMVVLAAKDEPWNGLLLCTSHEHHSSLMREFASLRPHLVLGKWLYISQNDEEFEKTAQKVISLARKADPRIGVDSSRKIRKDRAKRS